MPQIGEPACTAARKPAGGPLTDLVQIIRDRTQTEHTMSFRSDLSATRSERQYINIDRSFANDRSNFPGDDVHFEFGPAITLRAAVPDGTYLKWTATADPANAENLARSSGEDLGAMPGCEGYRGPGFGKPDSGVMSLANRADQTGWSPDVTFFFSTYGGDAFTITVSTPDGSSLSTTKLVVWRRLWCDVVEMRRESGNSTFRLEDDDSDATLAGIQKAFGPAFIEISSTGAPPQVGEHQPALSDRTADQWSARSYKPTSQYKGKKFSYMIVDDYPETRRAFLRFETFCTQSRFQIRFDREKKPGNLTVLALRAVRSYTMLGDKYWRKYPFNPSPDDATVDPGSPIETIDDKRIPRDQGITLPRKSAQEVEDFLPSRLQEGIFRIRRSQIYTTTYFSGDLAAPLHKEFDQGASPLESGVEIDLRIFMQDGKTRPLPKFFEGNEYLSLESRLFVWPIFVEIEVDTDPRNFGGLSYVVGNASKGNRYVYISRGKIEQLNASRARSSEEMGRIVRRVMSRVGAHELAHALGLVPDRAFWENEQTPGHCKDQGCLMWPEDDETHTEFHGEPVKNSCINFLRGLILDEPFP